MKIWVIARLTFFEAVRRRIVLAALLLGVAFLAVFGLGFNFIMDDLAQSGAGPNQLVQNEIANFLTLAGLYVVNFLTIMMSVLTSVDTVSGEIATGTIQSIITKPIRRWEIMFGKWLGFNIMLLLYVLLMAGGIMGLVWWIGDYTTPNGLQGIWLLWLNGMLMLSISLAGGAFLSTLANGVLVFGLFGVAFVGGWIEQIGSVISNQAAINIGIASSLILPSEAIWRRATFELQSPLVSAVGFSPFTAGGSVPSPLMIYYGVAYLLVVLGIGAWIFSRRDL
jgi:ABC-type transport system involved in multi-copper enzyme maturation permease subunit